MTDWRNTEVNAKDEPEIFALMSAQARAADAPGISPEAQAVFRSAIAMLLELARRRQFDKVTSASAR